MRHFLHTIPLLAVLCIVTPAIAADAGAGAGTAVTLEADTIATTNALEDGSELGDRALELRGSISRALVTDLGTFRLRTGFDLTRYDRHDFADDSSFGIEAGHEAELAGRWSLRTNIGYLVVDEGDDLNLGFLSIATRQTTQRFHGDITIGWKLSDDLLAALTISDRYDAVGKARFQLPLPETRLTPDRNVASAALSIAAAGEGVSYALIAEASAVSLHNQVPLQNAVPFESYALRARMIAADYKGWQLSGEIGLRRIRDDLGIFDELRPVYSVAVSRQLFERLTLKAGIDCDFDTEDTNDPLATYWRRVSLEGVVRVTDKLEAGAGAFVGIGENLLLENEEHDRGVYAAAAYAVNPKLSLLLRVDYVHKRYTIIDLEDETLTARFGIRTQL